MMKQNTGSVSHFDRWELDYLLRRDKVPCHNNKEVSEFNEQIFRKLNRALYTKSLSCVCREGIFTMKSSFLQIKFI